MEDSWSKAWWWLFFVVLLFWLFLVAGYIIFKDEDVILIKVSMIIRSLFRFNKFSAKKVVFFLVGPNKEPGLESHLHQKE